MRRRSLILFCNIMVLNKAAETTPILASVAADHEKVQEMVELIYFARLREALGTGSETLALPPEVRTVAALTDFLRARGGDWQTQLAPEKPVRVAVNQEMATPETAIADGDEIAYFPPVTGG